MKLTGLENIQTELPLGKLIEQHDYYDPSVLVGIPRGLARELEDIDVSLFHGQDLWNCWELSWLDLNGRPNVRIGQLVVPADSPNICESKSLKLYLNGFANEQLGTEADLVERVEADLLVILGVKPQFNVYTINDSRFVVEAPKGICIDGIPINLAVYNPDAALLQVDPTQRATERFYSHLFRSKCPITSQPDWATVIVEYNADVRLLPETLLAYLVSYRNHTGFHEACIEKIFQDIFSVLNPCELVVWAGFVRRGGIDINPVRSINALKFLPPRLARH